LELGQHEDAAPRSRAAPRIAAVHPDEGHAGGPRRRAVDGRVVSDVDRFPRPHSEAVERDPENARVGLGEAAALRGDHHLEEPRDPGGGEPRTLHAVDAVGDDPQPIALAQGIQQRPAAGQPVAARREPVEVALAQPPRPRGISARLAQEAAKALAGERGLRDLAATVGRPQRRVDPDVGEVRFPGAGKPDVGERLAERDALRAVEVEQRAVEVEQDGAEPGQGYLAR